LPFFFFFLGNLGPVWPLGGSTEARVMCDIDQSSWSTGGCVTRDCRFERNCTVYWIVSWYKLSKYICAVTRSWNLYGGLQRFKVAL
jgi:hypothetical protein